MSKRLSLDKLFCFSPVAVALSFDYVRAYFVCGCFLSMYVGFFFSLNEMPMEDILTTLLKAVHELPFPQKGARVSQ